MRILAAVAAFTTLAAPGWADDKPQSQKSERAAASSTPVNAHKVNLNTASRTDLEGIPGIGPSIADAIIEARPFKSISELKDVKGVGEARFGEIVPHVTVRGSSATAVGGPASASSGTTASEKPTSAAQEKNRAPKSGNFTPNAGGPPSPQSEKPTSEAQEKNRAPKNAQPDSNVSAPKGPGSDSEKPTSEAQAKNRASTARSERSEHAAKVNLNTASKAELEALPGIGAINAQAIMDQRPFKSLDAVTQVKGITDGTFGRIKDQITIE